MSDYGTPPPPPPGGGTTPPGGATPPPAPGYNQPMGGGQPPKNYLVWAILSTVLCCLPLGVASIIFAAQVNGKWASGDHAGAVASSEKAKKFAIASAVVGIIGGIIYAVFVLPNLDTSGSM